jgi:protein-disulfide isomerase
MRKILDHAMDASIVLMLAFVAYMSWQPGSLPRERVNEWLRNREIRKALTTEWPRMTANGSRLDSAGGLAQLVEFSDYECPFCRKTNAMIDTLVQRGLVHVSYVHLPLSIHPAADDAARSALCAEAQGRFREMHHQLMTTDAWQRDSNWVREATQAGVKDRAAFLKCLNSESTTSRLKLDAESAQKLRVNATPTFFSRTEMHVGTGSPADIQKLARQK